MICLAFAIFVVLFPVGIYICHCLERRYPFLFDHDVPLLRNRNKGWD